MTHAEFMVWAAEELNHYQASPEFKVRVAEVRTRQAAGEDLGIEEIASALGIPLWLAELSMLQAETSVAAHVVIPDKQAVN